MGYISKRNNPKYKWDRTLQYRVNLVNIAKDLKKNGYPLSDYKIEIPENEKTITHECVINNESMENQTQVSDEAIPDNTNIDYLNRDYNSEITNKDNTSINIDGEVHTSFSEKPTARAVTRDEMLLKEKDMVDRFNNICDNDIDNSAICDCVKDGFKMYMQLYEIYFHKVHPILTDKTLKNICSVLSTITDTEHGHFNADDIYETDDKGITALQRMINDHFIREHRESTNYSITHFANVEYLGKLANRFIEM